jgi:hypothetical protein
VEDFDWVWAREYKCVEDFDLETLTKTGIEDGKYVELAK